METSGKSLLCEGNRCQLRTLSSFEADTYFIFFSSDSNAFCWVFTIKQKVHLT